MNDMDVTRIEYSEAFIGDCTTGSCDRPATVRIHDDFVVCALHHMMYVAGGEEDSASLSLTLLKSWRSQAEVHGLDGLIRDLNKVVDEENERFQDATERMEALKRVDAEMSEQETRQKMAEFKKAVESERWPTAFSRVLWVLAGSPNEGVADLATRVSALANRGDADRLALEARLRDADALQLDPEFMCDISQGLDLTDSQMVKLAKAYAFEDRL